MKAYIYTEAIQFFIVVETVPGGVIVNIWTTDTVLFLITALPTKTLPSRSSYTKPEALGSTKDTLKQ